MLHHSRHLNQRYFLALSLLFSVNRHLCYSIFHLLHYDALVYLLIGANENKNSIIRLKLLLVCKQQRLFQTRNIFFQIHAKVFDLNYKVNQKALDNIC